MEKNKFTIVNDVDENHQDNLCDSCLFNKKNLIKVIVKKNHKSKEISKLTASKRTKYKSFTKRVDSIDKPIKRPPSYEKIKKSSQSVISSKSDINNKVVYFDFILSYHYKLFSFKLFFNLRYKIKLTKMTKQRMIV